ncbi:OPT superfamily oligopeptide transporter, partial [Rhizoclosmatium globosum]
MVSKIVSLEDDPNAPVLTFRYFVLSLLLSVFAGTLGQLYYFKPQTLVVSTLFLLLFGYFGGLLLQNIMPTGILNPGKFNIKEHVLVTITASAAGISALASQLIAVEYLYYNNLLPHWVGILLVLSSQLIGYGFAGIFRHVLVYPGKNYYPALLAQVSLYENLHKGDGISRQMTRYFFTVVGCIFLWEWLPNWIAPTLIGVSVICLSTQHMKSSLITNLFGGINNNEGQGMFSICFDWNNIQSNTMTWPWVTQVNYLIGVGLCCLINPLLYYYNVWDSRSLAFMGEGIYNPDGSVYNQTLILDENNYLNRTAYLEQGEPLLTATNAFYFFGCNLSVTAGLMHVFLWHREDVVAGFKNIVVRNEDSSNEDPYYLLMQKYKEAPLWWYLGILAIFGAVGLVVTNASNSQLEWYYFLAAMALSCVLVFVVGFIVSTTGFTMNSQSFVQLVGGFIKPGNPVANMYFTLYGYSATTQAVSMLADLKLGQYMKIPPQAVFFAQMMGSTVGAIFNYAVTISIMTQQADVLTSENGNSQWSGQNLQTFNTLSVTWGALAKEMYAPGARYQWITYAFILGIFCPLSFYYLHRVFPKARFDYLNFAILPWFLGYLSSGTNSSIFVAMIIGVFTQFYLRQYKASFFNRYQYLTSAALDAGTQFCVFVVTLFIQGAIYPAIEFPTWALN